MSLSYFGQCPLIKISWLNQPTNQTNKHKTCTHQKSCSTDIYWSLTLTGEIDIELITIPGIAINATTTTHI